MRIRELQANRETLAAYWRATRQVTTRTLAIWALVSFGAIALVVPLDRFVVFGFPLGYYFGAQGSVLVFVVLVALYARSMNRLDREHGLQEEGEE